MSNATLENSTMLYERMESKLLDYVSTQHVMPGQKLESTDKLAKKLGTSVGTLQHTLQRLAAKGIVSRTRRVGTVLLDDISEAGSRAGRQISKIALIVPDIRLPSFSHLFAELQAFCREDQVEVTPLSTDNAIEEYIRAINFYKDKENCGLVIAPPLGRDLPLKMLMALEESKTPLVTLFRDIYKGRWPTVCSDDFGACRDMVTHLYESGRRRIGYVAVDGGDRSKALLLEFINRLAELGLTYDPRHALLLPSRWSDDQKHKTDTQCEEGMRSQIMSWLQRNADAIDGLCCAGDQFASIALRNLNLLGKTVPEDVAIIGGGGIAVEMGFRPGEIASMAVDYKKMCRTIIDLLNQMAAGEAVKASQVVIEDVLIEGLSLRK